MKTNFCDSKNTIISKCKAINPSSCKYYSKARFHENRCMYQSIDLGDYYNCSNVEAIEDQDDDEPNEAYYELLDSNIPY